MKKFSEEEIKKMLDEYKEHTLIYRMLTEKGIDRMLKLENFYYHHYNVFTKILLLIPYVVVSLADSFEHERQIRKQGKRKKFSEEEIEKMLDEYESETLIYRMYTKKGVDGMLKLANFYYHHYNEYTRIFLMQIPCGIVDVIDAIEYGRERWKEKRECKKSKKQ